MVPMKITPNPIIQTIVDLRFRTEVPSGAVFGLVYDQLKSSYPHFEQRPILQMPESIREKDPAFQYEPWYAGRRGSAVLSVGPRIIALTLENYNGWESFSTDLKPVLETLQKISLINQLERVAIRYVNFFPENFLEITNACITFAEEQVSNDPVFLRTEVFKSPFKCVVQMANRATVQRNGKRDEGSVIDLDAFVEGALLPSGAEDNLLELIHQGNTLCKGVFFGLLRKEYVEKCCPVYPKKE
ncbi:MAG: TIGR04255 family protein [Candidatus Riflebacteria bacterium]|nr:TIGR04255 family protein [Candidatus Riflebacteria bacterium]